MDVVGLPLRLAFRFMVRTGLRGVWLRGEPPAGPFVWAANHHSWWDAFAAGAYLWSRGRSVTLLMEGGNLRRFRFLRRIGVLGTSELRGALRALGEGRVVIIFPEGDLRPPGPLAPLRRGAGWLAARAGVPLVAVATRVTVRGHQAPEAYLDLRPATPEGLEGTLREALAAIDAEIARTDPREPLPGFARALRGARSWDERLGGGAP